MSNAQRIAVLVAAVVGLAVAFVVLSGGDETDESADTVPAAARPATSTGSTTATQPAAEPEPEPAPRVPEIVVRDGEPVDGVQRIEVESGTQVRFVVRSVGTPDEEVHLHGYDIEKPLPSGGKATFTLKADAEGIFEIELHGSAVPIGQLRVVPG